tara:strand:- start:48 stop:317 length:270 start_codon:yes stop_codon:yes gene_type:complete
MVWVLPNELIDVAQALGIPLDIPPTSVGKKSKASIPKPLDFLPLLFVRFLRCFKCSAHEMRWFCALRANGRAVFGQFPRLSAIETRVSG